MNQGFISKPRRGVFVPVFCASGAGFDFRIVPVVLQSSLFSSDEPGQGAGAGAFLLSLSAKETPERATSPAKARAVFFILHSIEQLTVSVHVRNIVLVHMTVARFKAKCTRTKFSRTCAIFGSSLPETTLDYADQQPGCAPSRGGVSCAPSPARARSHIRRTKAWESPKGWKGKVISSDIAPWPTAHNMLAMA